jgi:hypothetical protein
MMVDDRDIARCPARVEAAPPAAFGSNLKHFMSGHLVPTLQARKAPAPVVRA